MSQHDMEVSIGDANTGPTWRVQFNAALQALASCSSGDSPPTTTYPLQLWADTLSGRLKQRNAANTDWFDRGPLDQDVASGVISGLVATAGGTADAITLALTPAMTALTATPIWWRATGANTSTTPTVQRDALVAKTLVKGNNLPLSLGDIPGAGAWMCSQYDATFDKEVLLNPAKAVSRSSVRQTVLSGPVNINGIASFGGATGSTTVTATGTLSVTAAGGSDAGGDNDRAAVITNPSWTGLSTNGTMYLYLDIAADGTVTTGSTALQPIYQEGGTYSTTSGQATFNIQEMIMKVGNGSAASQVYRVFVGEVTVAGGVVTAITWYALRGRYRAPLGGSAYPAAATRVTFAHNLGVPNPIAQHIMQCIATDLGFSVGESVDVGSFSSSTGTVNRALFNDRLEVGMIDNAATPYTVNRATAAFAAITRANWNYRPKVTRSWGGS